MNLNDMLEVDRNDILVNQIIGGYWTQNYFKSDNLKIKIYINLLLYIINIYFQLYQMEYILYYLYSQIMEQF